MGIYKLITKVLARVRDEYNYILLKRNYNYKNYLNEQIAKFSDLGLCYETGQGFSTDNTMQSEHSYLFKAISNAKNFDISSILEIGTYDGENAKLLADLFPTAKVTTIDLPEDDSDFVNLYDRSEENVRRQFLAKRNDNLATSANIVFKEKNSVNLSLDHHEKYDLIWVDGYHGYPTVAIDITNAIKMINKNGIIICDDVYTNCKVDTPYASKATYEVLCEYKKAGVIDFSLLHKRIARQGQLPPKDQKYIAVVRVK